jgi:hypothetical protein
VAIACWIAASKRVVFRIGEFREERAFCVGQPPVILQTQTNEQRRPPIRYVDDLTPARHRIAENGDKAQLFL